MDQWCCSYSPSVSGSVCVSFCPNPPVLDRRANRGGCRRFAGAAGGVGNDVYYEDVCFEPLWYEDYGHPAGGAALLGFNEDEDLFGPLWYYDGHSIPPGSRCTGPIQGSDWFRI